MAKPGFVKEGVNRVLCVCPSCFVEEDATTVLCLTPEFVEKDDRTVLCLTSYFVEDIMAVLCLNPGFVKKEFMCGDRLYKRGHGGCHVCPRLCKGGYPVFKYGTVVTVSLVPSL